VRVDDKLFTLTYKPLRSSPDLTASFVTYNSGNITPHMYTASIVVYSSLINNNRYKGENKMKASTAAGIAVILFTVIALLAVPALLLLATGDYQGAASLYGQTEDSATVAFILNLRETFIK
jgi:hypothetical protein